ncbi:rubrerythrin [Heliobacterium gestii]|uniref:Rubrerythrin n=1 Tax=Heliomicrobium gestii TaxID=2699 RepID=A0A845L4I9_HELGE|nr:ferritin family protein [Heliomicrobium gestii]MBM7865225.1 rubrerythrin [Heliomicrobium gestii]MZP41492.1 rubrerythrin [Heliomicrobium gestii]
MSIFGLTKGTDFENEIEKNQNGETQGAVMYAAAAYIAGEKGLHEAAELLLKIAVDELRHAGLYAVLNGKVNMDIFETMGKIQPIEVAAESRLKEFAQKLGVIGAEVTSAVEAVAKDEAVHGERLRYLLEKYQK